MVVEVKVESSFLERIINVRFFWVKFNLGIVLVKRGFWHLEIIHCGVDFENA